MSSLTSKFEFLHGHFEGNDQATMTMQFAPATGYTPDEGDVVYVINDSGVPKVQAFSSPSINEDVTGVFAAASDGSPTNAELNLFFTSRLAALTDALASGNLAWIVQTGMNAAFDWDTIQSGNVPCVKGTFVIETTNYDTDTDTYTIGDTVRVVTGQLRAQPADEKFLPYGQVVGQDTTNNVLTVAVGHW